MILRIIFFGYAVNKVLSMTRFKIKSLKAFSLIELLVSIVIIAAITMLISSAFIGMMTQKRNLQIKETAEDMSREIISTVTRNSDNLELLLYKIKKETSVPISPTYPVDAQMQFESNRYCPSIVAFTPCSAKNLGFTFDLTNILKLDGKPDNASKSIYSSLYSTGFVVVPDATFITSPPNDLLIDTATTLSTYKHPQNAALPTTGVNDQKYRFFKEAPDLVTTDANIIRNQRYRNGIFSFIDRESLNMKMNLLPKNSGGVTNTKVFLHVGLEHDNTEKRIGNPIDLVASSFMEPENAIDYTKKALILTAEIKYSSRSSGGITASSTEGTSVIFTKPFHPTMIQGDASCMGIQKPASCPDCRASVWSPGCDPCKSYSNGVTIPRATGAFVNPSSITIPPQSVTCP